MDKSNWSLIFESQNRRERERGEEKREVEEEEEKKKRRCEAKIKKGMDSMILVWNLVHICIDTCLWVMGCRKPNPRMSSCMEIIINSFVFLGFCYEKI